MSRLRHRLVEFMLERGGLIGVLTLIVYVVVAPAQIVDGDNAEFATLGALGGTAHPTGYPLTVLWLRLWSWLPAASPAHAGAIAIALLGAAQVVVLHAACRGYGARSRAADAAVIMFAATPTVLAMHTEAEVFAMNGLVVAIVLWLSTPGAPVRGLRRCIALALVAGLGLSNHVTCALVGGIGILGFVRGVRETDRKPHAIGLGLVALAVGLSPYLYLLVAPEHPGTWGKPSSVAEIARMFLRDDYGGPTAFAAGAEQRYPAANLAFLAHTIGRAFLWLPAVLGLAAIGYRIRRPEGETRWGWVLLLLSILLAGPVLATRFNLEPNLGVTSYVIERFHLLPLALFVVPVACGLDLALGWLAARVPGQLVRSRRFATLVLVGGFVGVVALSLPHVVRTHAPAVEELVTNTLRSLPERAVVIGTADDFHNGSAYVQQVLGIRADVEYVMWPMMGLTWYRERKAQRGVTFAAGPTHPSVRIAEHVLGDGRALFVDITAADILKTFPHYPYGIFYRVLPQGAQRPPVEQILAINQELFAKFQLSYPRPGRHDRWPTIVHEKYAWTWRVLARDLERAGRHEDAAWARAAAREIGPQE